MKLRHCAMTSKTVPTYATLACTTLLNLIRAIRSWSGEDFVSRFIFVKFREALALHYSDFLRLTMSPRGKMFFSCREMSNQTVPSGNSTPDPCCSEPGKSSLMSAVRLCLPISRDHSRAFWKRSWCICRWIVGSGGISSGTSVFTQVKAANLFFPFQSCSLTR